MFSNVWTQCITILTIGYTIVSIFNSKSISNFESKKIEYNREIELERIKTNERIELKRMNFQK